MPIDIAIQFHEVIVLIFVSFILFVIGTWVSAKINVSVNKKPLQHGSKDVCGACEALIEMRRIPDMDRQQKELEKEQRVLRSSDGVLARLDKTVGELTVATASLKEDCTSLRTDVKKLFNMIETNWQGEIQTLKNKLSEKDQQIRRLESKG